MNFLHYHRRIIILALLLVAPVVFAADSIEEEDQNLPECLLEIEDAADAGSTNISQRCLPYLASACQVLPAIQFGILCTMLPLSAAMTDTLSNTTFAPATNVVAPSYSEAPQNNFIYGNGAWGQASGWVRGFASNYPAPGY